jgi:hypothetical protein
VIVDVRTHNLDPALWAGDYQEDAEFRASVQRWVSDLWEQKDARIERLQKEW